MLFSVPQYIDVEDKVAGPLTVKQLLWMIAMGAILLIMWFSITIKSIFFIAAVPIVLVFVALAFYRPYGQPLVGFIAAGIMFLFGPKVYVWRRTATKKKMPSTVQRKINVEIKKEALGHEERKQAALNNLGSIAKILDSQGNESDRDIVEILKAPERRK